MATKASARKAILDEWAPGGVEWTKQRDAWIAASKADPIIGGDKYKQSIRLAGEALVRYGDAELAELLDETGFGVHPVVLRFLAKVGKGSMVDVWYGNSVSTPRRAKRIRK